MEQLVQGAIDAGINEIAITDHLEFYIDKSMMDKNRFKEYFIELDKCRQKFKGKIVIKSGIELGQSHYYIEGAKDVLSEFHFDYVMGSIHKIMADDMAHIDYDQYTLDKACSAYFGEILNLIEQGDFDCLGHIDVIKRYASKYYGVNIKLDKYMDVIEEILKRLILKGRGIEINSSGLRQDAGEPFPGRNVVNLYKELGGEILTLGSDAHVFSDVGRDIDKVKAIALEAGFKYLTHYNERKPEFIRIE
jgi:histidinol-phosphatase (PHP family)